MDWFKGTFTGKLHIYWENLWFLVDFTLNQSIDGYNPQIKVVSLCCRLPALMKTLGNDQSEME